MNKLEIKLIDELNSIRTSINSPMSVSFNCNSINDDYTEIIKYLNSINAVTYDKYVIGATGKILYIDLKPIVKDTPLTPLPASLPLADKSVYDWYAISTSRLSFKLDISSEGIVVKLRTAPYDSNIKIRGIDSLNWESFHDVIKSIEKVFPNHFIQLPFQLLDQNEKKMIGSLTISKFLSIGSNLTRLFDSRPIGCDILADSIIINY